ncbi:MAG: GGDEF domain-containing protein [Nitrosomonas sp.]|nr:GGDEF domain-containing protein [Nitrosomonas sp.]
MSTLIVAKPVHLKSLQNEYAVGFFWILLCGVTICIFLFDLNTPLGVAAGTPYALVIFGSLWLKSNQSTYAFVLISTLLTVAGFFLSPGYIVPIDIVLTNRLLALLIIACTAFMVIKIKKVNQALISNRADSYRDALTHCKTNRAFVLELNTEITRCKRYNHNLSLAIFDVDHFTRLVSDHDKKNEYYRNHLIKWLSKEICKSIRNSDQPYRISSDRFAILFVETDIHEAKEVCNALREKIFKVNQSEFHPGFTVSVGIAALEINDNRRKLYKRAEQALIKAKENGRNQVSTLPEIKRNNKPLIPAILLRSRTG